MGAVDVVPSGPLAFWMASYNVGLLAGLLLLVGLRPRRLYELANSLPRLASTTAFLALVVAHLERPDIMYESLRRRTR